MALCSSTRLRYLQTGGNNPEILLQLAGMEQDAIALAQKDGDVNDSHRKNFGIYYCTALKTHDFLFYAGLASLYFSQLIICLTAEIAK